MEIEMLARVRDRVTGFEGVVVARCEYLTGCVQLDVAPGVDKDGQMEKTWWIDEQRLEVVSTDLVGKIGQTIKAGNARTPGGPQHTPDGMSHP